MFEKQNCRIELRLKGTSGNCLIQPLLLWGGSASGGCSGSCPASYWISPRVKIAQLLWETCSSVRILSWWGFFPLCLNETSYYSSGLSTTWPFSREMTWLHILNFHILQLLVYVNKMPLHILTRMDKANFSASQHGSRAPNTSSSWCWVQFSGIHYIYMYQETQNWTQHSSCGLSSAEEGSHRSGGGEISFLI